MMRSAIVFVGVFALLLLSVATVSASSPSSSSESVWTLTGYLEKKEWRVEYLEDNAAQPADDTDDTVSAYLRRNGTMSVVASPNYDGVSLGTLSVGDGEVLHLRVESSGPAQGVLTFGTGDVSAAEDSEFDGEEAASGEVLWTLPYSFETDVGGRIVAVSAGNFTVPKKPQHGGTYTFVVNSAHSFSLSLTSAESGVTRTLVGVIVQAPQSGGFLQSMGLPLLVASVFSLVRNLRKN
eukprot:PhM_4_TR5015/c0_g1_i1/m.6304